MRLIKTITKVVLLAIVGAVILWVLGMICWGYFHLTTNTFYNGKSLAEHYLSNPLFMCLLSPFAAPAVLGWLFFKYNMAYTICASLLSAIATVYTVAVYEEEKPRQETNATSPAEAEPVIENN